jgi:predicted membrane protein
MNVIMEQKKSSRSRKGLLGLILVVAGLLLVGNQFDMLPGDYRDVIFSWQSFLIVLGLIMLTGKDNKATGFILIFVGAFFLVPKILDVPYDWTRLFWPVVLVVIGASLIFGTAFWRRRGHRLEGTTDDYVDDVNIFGGHDRNITSQEFRGGSIVSVFGGGKYDLRNSKLSSGSNELELTNVFGGIKLIVPSDWDVRIEVVAIFGGYSDKRIITSVNNDQKLVIKGVSIFGGGEVVSI